MKTGLKFYFEKYRHAVPLILYGIFYLSWFFLLEKRFPGGGGGYRIIHVAMDDYIPFCELFVIPYFLWFAYASAVVLFFLFQGKEDYYRICVFLFTGMTVFLIVSTLFPNGQHLRPQVMPRDNIFTHMIAHLYRTDTPTNLWPSIHVYNSLGAHFAIVKSEYFSNKKWIRRGSLLLSVSIILSTMFIKQHSVFDVMTAFILAAVMYGVVYKYDIVTAYRVRGKARKKTAPQI